MTNITFPHSLLSQLRAHVRREHPREACGLIGGLDGFAQIVLPIPNIDPDPLLRYTMDAASMVQAIFHLRRLKLDVIAIYHSHPHEAAVPSATDIAEATWSEVVYVIVGTGEDEVRAWQIRGDKAQEIGLQIVL